MDDAESDAPGAKPTEADLGAVFSLVADETRVGVLQTLWDARTAGEGALSFSTLRERAGVTDSGRFNYHLDRLVPEFVRKTEAGYALSYAGQQTIGDAVAGTYTAAAETTVEPTPVRDCPEPDCSGTIEATYENGYARFDCDSCDRPHDTVSVPPIVVEAHDTDPATAASRFSQTVVERIARGFCPMCDGPITSVIARTDSTYEPRIDGVVDVVHECDACRYRRRSGAVLALIGHPAVVSLLYDAGIDYRTVPLWEQAWTDNRIERLVDTDPARVEIETTIDGTRHTFVLDESLELLAVE